MLVPLHPNKIGEGRWQEWRNAILAEAVRRGVDEQSAARLLDTTLREDFIELERAQQALLDFRVSLPKEQHQEAARAIHTYRRHVGETLYQFMLGFLERRAREVERRP